MKVLSRYLLRQHGGPLVFALGLLTFVLLMNEVIRRFDELAGKGLAAQVIGQVFLLSLPFILAQIVPIAVLVASLTVFGHLAADHELTALKANGVAVSRLLRPLMGAVGLLAVGMVWFNGFLLPQTNHRLKTLLLEIARTRPTFQLREGRFIQVQQDPFHPLSGTYLRVEAINRKTDQLTGVTLFQRVEGEKARTIFAREGEMAFTQGGRDLQLTLHHGVIHEVNLAEPGEYRLTDFEVQRILLRDVGRPFEQDLRLSPRGDRELTLSMLRAGIREAQQRLGALDTTSSGEGYFQARRKAQLEVEWQKKFALAAACLVLLLAGSSLGAFLRGHSLGLGLGLSLVVFVVYYALIIGGERLADRLLVAPWLAMWFPNLFFLGVSLVLLWVTFYDRHWPWRLRKSKMEIGN